MERSLLTAALVAIALMPASAAEHCQTYSTSDAELAVDATSAGGSTIYTDVDFCQLCTYGFMLWVYEESNGIDGLQRGDEMVDDTCHHSIRPDTIIF